VSKKLIPGVDRPIHQIEGLRFGLAHAEEGGRRSDAAEVAAAESRGGNPKARRSQRR
jgi:hypothetical protein